MTDGLKVPASDGEPRLTDVRATIAEIRDRGYSVCRLRFAHGVVAACRDAFWPILVAHRQKHAHEPNRGVHRHFLPMPFEAPCFVPQFICHEDVLAVVRGAMDETVVADQWGCDVPVRGSDYQGAHVDYQRPLFQELLISHCRRTCWLSASA